jgi:rhamnose transport system ATP-binding protein
VSHVQQTVPVVHAERISKAYGGVHALTDVCFDVRAGEVHALVGENGAGKSTLIRILTGAEVPNEGTVIFRGQTASPLDPALARRLGIVAVYQQPALFPDLTVAENIALATEPAKAFRRVNWKRRREHAAEVLDRVGVVIRPDALVRSLTLPQQQLLDIARAIDENPAVMILDEPTASLGPRETENLISVVEALRNLGTAIIYISHRFEELFRIADRVTVLRDGRSMGTFAMRDMSHDRLIHLMIGRDLESRVGRSGREFGPPVLEVRGLNCRRSRLRDVSFALRRGEVLGLAGLAGSGRTELAECIFGLVPADGGEILLDGARRRLSSPAEALDAGIAYVPEDRRRHGIIGAFSVACNVTLSSLRQVARFGFLRTREEDRLAQEYVRRLRVRTASADAPADELSGGNQQKVVLARSLLTEPRILILDEPTQGVDIGGKAEIHALIDELAARGIAILLISSDLPEILRCSDRVAVMNQGRLAGVLEGEQIDATAVMKLALPRAVALA